MPLNASEQRMLDLINAERAEVGAQPLVFDETLVQSSEAHSQWMLGAEVFDHTGVNGSSPGDRMHEAGYTPQAGWGENIAWASLRGAPGTLDEVELLHDNLMNSPGHRANILNPDFTAVGVGFEVGEFSGHEAAMVTQNFGTALTTAVAVTPSSPVVIPTATPAEAPIEVTTSAEATTDTVAPGSSQDVRRVDDTNGNQSFELVAEENPADDADENQLSELVPDGILRFGSKGERPDGGDRADTDVFMRGDAHELEATYSSLGSVLHKAILNLLHNNGLGRDADGEGRAHWKTELKSAIERELGSSSESAEDTTLVAAETHDCSWFS